MRGINRVELYGFVSGEPECAQLQNGLCARFSMATNEPKKDAAGQWTEEAEFHRVVAFGKVATTVQSYVHKGMPLLIEGKLKTRKYLDKQNQDRWITEVIIKNLYLIGTRSGTGGNTAWANQGYQNQFYGSPAPQGAAPAPQTQGNYSGQNVQAAQMTAPPAQYPSGMQGAPKPSPVLNNQMPDDEIPF